MAAIAQIKRLTKKFHTLTAVEDLSFTVEEGDVYGFLGQNGAGKSTTLRMLLSLVSPTSGAIELLGMNLATHRKEILREIGAVIEQPELYTFLSALENLQLFSRLSGRPLKRPQLMEQLELVGLAGRAKDAVSTYSMGMKQRLGLAVALVHDPQLLILDEPTNGLDPQGIADIRNLILHLSRDRKKTLIISSHLLSEVQVLATRILIIDKGRKVVEGAADQLLDPADTMVLLETLDNAGARAQLGQSHWASSLQPSIDKETILLKMDKQQIPAFNEDLVRLHIGVVRLEPRHTLEDYFLHLTTSSQHVAPFAN